MKKYTLETLPTELKPVIEPYLNLFGSLGYTMKVEVYKPKENIIKSGRPLKNLRYLVRGKAKITLIHENGNQSIVHFVKPEEYVGELTFLGIEKQPKSISAICDCIFLSVPLDLARDVLKNEPSFLFELSQCVGQKMLYRTNFSSKNQNYALKNRLAAYMLMSEHEGIYTEKHTETAEYLGVSYRHLLYTLKAFVEEGLIEKRRKGYLIHRLGLELLAKDIEIG